MSRHEALTRTGLCDHLSPQEVFRLASECREVVLEPGEPLIEMGDLHDSFQVIDTGQISVRRPVDGEDREVARLGPGTIIGEIAMLTDGPATATVVASTRTRSVEVPRHVFEKLLRSPEVRRRVDHLVERRTATNRLDRVAPIEVHDVAGQHFLLRPLWPDDWRLMELARDRVSDDTLRRRFFTLPKLHEGFLRRLSDIDYVDQFAWAVLDVEDHALAAVGRYGRLPQERDAAELALLVADDLQGHGLGRLLTTALGAAAAEHGVETFTATAQADNSAVQDLLAKFGATWVRGERGQEVEARWPVAAVLANAGDAPVEPLRAAARAILQG